MVSADQPLKKRKLYESHNSPPQSLSDDEIQRRRRNQEEIRNVYEHYKLLKQCISNKNPNFMPKLEESYLALLTASRGCTSVQRIVAEFIPRYASFCPTALEAATKAVINIHNCSLAVINRGEDGDGVACRTATLCISGLVEICQAAQSEAPTSSVIQRICSSVFIDVLSFFVSTFNGIDLFHIVDKGVLKMQDSTSLFSDFKQKISAEDDNEVAKLSKLRALSLIWILFCCPKNALAASFELCDSVATEELHNHGLYFLRQITSEFEPNDVANHVDSKKGGIVLSTDSDNPMHETEEITHHGLVSHDNHKSDGPPLILKKCLLGLVVSKNLPLRKWMFLRYKKFCTSASSQVASKITSLLEEVFQSFAEQVKAADDQLNSIEDNSIASKNFSAQYLGLKRQNSEICRRDGPYVNNLTEKLLDQKLTDSRPLISPETPMRVTVGSNVDVGGPRSMDFDTSDAGEVLRPRSSTPRDLLNNQMHSPIRRKSFDMRSNSFEGSIGHLQLPFDSPQPHMPLPSPSTSHGSWFSDGDPAAMDIFSASRRLWLGSLGPDASEALVRFQFEKFGPTEQFLYHPYKGFASVEYKNLMDAVRARGYMRGCAPWGAPLHVKFLDIGLGTRGAINGVAIGSCCHVYVGNVPTQWAKDEILHEIKKVVYKGPLMLTDLRSEMAVLMEFGNPEEAANVMAHLRQWRKESCKYLLPSNVGPANARMHLESSRHGPITPAYFRSKSGNSFTESPHAQTVLESPSESYRTKMSSLSTLLASLRAKYNIASNGNYCESYNNGNYQAASVREDGLPTNTLWISLPKSNSSGVTDDEVMIICNLALSGVGSVVSITRAYMPTGLGWYVECSSIDAASTVLKILRASQGIFFQVEFSYPGKHHGTSLQVKQDSCNSDSPRGSRGGLVANEQMWTYNNPKTEIYPAQGTHSFMTTASQGPPLPPQPNYASSSMRPYFPLSNCWEARSLSNPHPPNPASVGLVPTIIHTPVVPPPFLPPSVTPLTQMPGSSVQQFDQTFFRPAVPPPLINVPPQPELAPPLPPPPSSPPPLPQSLPPVVPPPPSSPPPLPPREYSNVVSSGPCIAHSWQGTLSKSGVHYCTVNAQRLHSDMCKYSNASSEPAEWPAKLDMTKRTDFRHVKTTFSSTPAHKREVCQLLPSAAGDYKGFQDFISYLKQRECAGVIKIPAARPMWARLLFILPYSPEVVSMLSISPTSTDCLVALVLPKETNFEWV
ncbi:uncharacterized protein LOC108214531 [Daucus carota subsp. sativus]|uniref:uncharacterized protein LOC108214531 n=1 Tax=Daucus carota subsp. sativus TaxID=79200 RepID=UPI0007EFED3B|nr:PREDICTED: uncharacterized protein LOC108214531 [Daucus carota subsp. sativus]